MDSMDKVGSIDMDNTGEMENVGVLVSDNNTAVVPLLPPPDSSLRLMTRTLLQAVNFAPPK